MACALAVASGTTCAHMQQPTQIICIEVVGGRNATYKLRVGCERLLPRSRIPR